MRCPNDATTELVADTLDRVAVHDCPDCGGVWLVRDNEAWFAAAESSGAAASSRKCPECGERMRTIRYPESGVEIDVCIADHGVWLDKGELDKITDTLTSAEGSATPDESLWSEVKDFVATVQSWETRFGTEHPTIAAAINAASRIGL